jgi:hypothetical protein
MGGVFLKDKKKIAAVKRSNLVNLGHWRYLQGLPWRNGS